MKSRWHLINSDLTDMHLTSMHLTGIYFTGVIRYILQAHFMSVQGCKYGILISKFLNFEVLSLSFPIVRRN